MRNGTLKPGQKYGNLKLIKRLENRNKHGAKLWLCECVCGSEKTVSSGKVRQGSSCGCVAKKKNEERGLPKGKKFGKLIVLKRLNEVDRFRSRKYLCECECGKQKIISSHNLTVGGVKSCGCLGRTKLPPGEAAFNQLYSQYRILAKRREFTFELTKDEFRTFTEGLCHYCGSPPCYLFYRLRGNGHYTYNGVDRVDPLIGYVSTNCVSCCGVCNTMKMDRTKEDFIKHICLIYKKQAGG